MWVIFRAICHVGDFSRRFRFPFCPKRTGAFADATISRSFANAVFVGQRETVSMSWQLVQKLD
jgi:hypothetical protein